MKDDKKPPIRKILPEHEAALRLGHPSFLLGVGLRRVYLCHGPLRPAWDRSNGIGSMNGFIHLLVYSLLYQIKGWDAIEAGKYAWAAHYRIENGEVFFFTTKGARGA